MGTTREPVTLRQAASLCAQEFTVTFDEDGHEEQIWVRTLSGPEMREAQVARHSARKAIRANYIEGTISHEEIAETLEGYTTNQLAAIIVANEMPVFADRARRDLPQPMEPDLSKYPTEEKRDKAQSEHDTRREEHSQRVYAKAIEYAQKREAELVGSTSIEELRKLVLGLSIRSAIDAQTQGFEDDYRIFNGFYEEDRTTKVFGSIDDVAAMSATMKEYFMAFVNSVDIVLPIDIKNSQSRFGQEIGSAANTKEATKGRSTEDLQGSSSPKKSSRGGRKT